MPHLSTGFRLIIGITAASVSLLCVAGAANAQQYKAPRTFDGQPDLQGTWTNASLTTLLRPKSYGDRLVMSNQEAEAMERQRAQMTEASNAPSDLSRDLPQTGNVGGYNAFWMDAGNRVATVNGQKRTSIIVDPPSGQLPALTAQGQAAFDARAKRVATVGFDGPETRALGERCILGFGNNSGPPMVPVIYNSNYQIVQGPGVVVIMAEMAHDARIVRINGTHPASHIRKWMGDSIGRWDGDTLVVETTNFHPQQPMQIGAGAQYRMFPVSEQFKVTERFTRTDAQTLLYQFAIDDPGTFAQAWRGEMPLNMTKEPIYEYACHEGNYALPGILAGAREQEKKAPR